MPSDDDTMSDDVIWETLPVSLSLSIVGLSWKYRFLTVLTIGLSGCK